MVVSTFERIVFQLIISIVVIITNTVSFYFLTSSQYNSCRHQYTCAKRNLNELGISMTFVHVLGWSCLLCMAILALWDYYFTNHLIIVPNMEKTETMILLVVMVTSMYHILCVMLNVYKFKINLRLCERENMFYVVVIWISILLFAILLFFIKREEKIVRIVCLIVLCVDFLFIVAYIIVKHDKYNLVSMQVDGTSCINKQLLFIYFLLISSFVSCTIAFIVERLVWQQNKMVSYTCISLNSFLHGLIFLYQVLHRL